MKGLLRPLNDLVEKYGKHLNKSQLITFDGNIYAVAFMANAQHIWYRESIFNELGIAVPTTYEEVIAAAEKLKLQAKWLIHMVVHLKLVGTYLKSL